MKMNKFLIAALTATVLFSSCSKQEEGGGATGKDTYMGISISIPAPKAQTDAVTKDWEKKINSLAVYILDANGTLHYDDNLAFVSDGSGGYKGTAAIKTTTGSKTIYVVANPTAAIKAKIATLRAAAFGTNGLGFAEGEYVVSTGAEASKYIVMTGSSAYSLTEVRDATQAVADANLVPVVIERNVAQVVVNFKQGFSNVADVLGGVVANAQFAPEAKAQNAFLAAQAGNLTLFGQIALFPVPALGDDSNVYFDNFSGVGTYQPVSTSTGAVADLKTAASFYCLENNIIGSTGGVNNKRAGNTTQARIKLQYTPATVVNSFVAATGVRTTAAGVANANFYIYKLDNSYWNQTAYDAAIASGQAAFAADKFSAVYENGWCFYKIYVQNAAGTIQTLRNNFYELTINKISGPGSPYDPADEDPQDPEDPTDPIEENSYLSISVTIRPWDLQSSTHILQ